MASMYLNEFHKQQFKRAEILRSSPSKRSWEERIAQFHWIKAQSTRTKREQPTADLAGSR